MYKIFLLLLVAFTLYYFNSRENWTMYQEKPYNYQRIGASPLHFYRRDRYRKPYRYPYKFYSEYPTKHFRYLD